MKVLLYLAVLICLTQITYAQSIITGHVKGLNEAKMNKIYLYDFGIGQGEVVIDSSEVTHDCSEFTLPHMEEKLYSLAIGEKKNRYTFMD